MLNHKIGREPTLEEISAEIGASQEEIVMALDSGVEVESLYKTIYQGDGSDIYLIDKLEEETSQNDAVLNQLVLEQLLDSLTEKEREIILMRYYEDKTQTQVAEKIGISQVQVSRLEKKILQKLRDKL